MSNSETVSDSIPGSGAGAPMPRWLKWALGVGLAAVVFVALLLLLLPMGLNQDMLRSRLERQIADWSGMALSVSGEAAISFFPFKATLTDVTSRDALGAVTMTARRLEARFSTLSVLSGKVDVSEVWLDGARVAYRQRPGIGLSAYAESGPLKPAIDIAKAAIVADRGSPNLMQIANQPLGSVRFTNSSLSFIWQDGREDLLTEMNATLQWVKLRSNATATGSAFWRGEVINFGINVASPLVLVSGGTSLVLTDFKSAPLNFDFNGNANVAADFFGDGKLTLKAPSISRILSWSAASTVSADNFGALAVSAKLTVSEGKLRLGDLLLSLDGRPAAGTLEIDAAATPAKLSGTLAFDALDLSSLAQSLPLGGENVSVGGGAMIHRPNLDLRVSAATANAGPWELKNAAGAIRLDDDAAQIDLGNAEIAGGTVSASLRIKGAGAERTAALKLAARNMMPGQISAAVSAYPRIDAPVSLQFDLTGAYTSFASFMQTAYGKLTAEAGAGVVRNFSADSFASGVRNGQIFALPDVYSGLSTLESGEMSAVLKQGAALVEASEININGQRIVLTGAVPYLSGGVALNGVIADQSDAGIWMPFFIGGSWDKPFVTLVPLQK
jgi:AsmA protein